MCYNYAMPNLKRHLTVGAVVGGGANLAWQLAKMYSSPIPPKGLWETIECIDFVQLAAFAAGGAAIAALPDLLEPATSPNHRALFHSLACGGVICFAAFGKHTEDMEPGAKHSLRVAALSYLSHLFLDGGTPKGLPIIGIRLNSYC